MEIENRIVVVEKGDITDLEQVAFHEAGVGVHPRTDCNHILDEHPGKAEVAEPNLLVEDCEEEGEQHEADQENEDGDRKLVNPLFHIPGQSLLLGEEVLQFALHDRVHVAGVDELDEHPSPKHAVGCNFAQEMFEVEHVISHQEQLVHHDKSSELPVQDH